MIVIKQVNQTIKPDYTRTTNISCITRISDFIKSLLKDVVDLQDITYKDTESYINILYKKNTRKWICRLKLTDAVKTLIVPDEEKKGQKFNLTSVYDLEQYNDLLHKTLARYM